MSFDPIPFPSLQGRFTSSTLDKANDETGRRLRFGYEPTSSVVVPSASQQRPFDPSLLRYAVTHAPTAVPTGGYWGAPTPLTSLSHQPQQQEVRRPQSSQTQPGWASYTSSGSVINTTPRFHPLAPRSPVASQSNWGHGAHRAVPLTVSAPPQLPPQQLPPQPSRVSREGDDATQVYRAPPIRQQPPPYTKHRPHHSDGGALASNIGAEVGTYTLTPKPPPQLRTEELATFDVGEDAFGYYSSISPNPYIRTRGRSGAPGGNTDGVASPFSVARSRSKQLVSSKGNSDSGSDAEMEQSIVSSHNGTSIYSRGTCPLAACILGIASCSALPECIAKGPEAFALLASVARAATSIPQASEATRYSSSLVLKQISHLTLNTIEAAAQWPLICPVPSHRVEALARLLRAKGATDSALLVAALSSSLAFVIGRLDAIDAMAQLRHRFVTMAGEVIDVRERIGGGGDDMATAASVKYLKRRLHEPLLPRNNQSRFVFGLPPSARPPQSQATNGLSDSLIPSLMIDEIEATLHLSQAEFQRAMIGAYGKLLESTCLDARGEQVAHGGMPDVKALYQSVMRLHQSALKALYGGGTFLGPDGDSNHKLFAPETAKEKAEVGRGRLRDRVIGLRAAVHREQLKIGRPTSAGFENVSVSLPPLLAFVVKDDALLQEATSSPVPHPAAALALLVLLESFPVLSLCGGEGVAAAKAQLRRGAPSVDQSQPQPPELFLDAYCDLLAEAVILVESHTITHVEYLIYAKGAAKGVDAELRELVEQQQRQVKSEMVLYETIDTQAAEVARLNERLARQEEQLASMHKGGVGGVWQPQSNEESIPHERYTHQTQPKMVPAAVAMGLNVQKREGSSRRQPEASLPKHNRQVQFEEPWGHTSTPQQPRPPPYSDHHSKSLRSERDVPYFDSHSHPHHHDPPSYSQSTEGNTFVLRRMPQHAQQRRPDRFDEYQARHTSDANVVMISTRVIRLLQRIGRGYRSRAGTGQAQLRAFYRGRGKDRLYHGSYY